MAHPKGQLTVTVGGEDYTLFVGMSVLADLQDKHGTGVLEKLDPPAGAGKNWLPDLHIVTDLMLGALQRYHADVADRWLVDDILAQNPNLIMGLMEASFPDADEGKRGNGKRPKRAAA